MARPTAYKAEYAIQAEKLCRFGATDVELADFFEVAVSTVYLWKSKHPEFSEALKVGKELADERVKRSLYQRAVGYSHPEDRVFNDGGKAMIVPTVKHYPPDTTAGIFWMKNRDPANWRDKHEVEHGGLTVTLSPGDEKL